jgi:phosphoadenosine phosphosulfate reductase
MHRTLDAPEFEDASPQEILTWALARFSGRIALSCSFGGPTGLVALDMALAIEPALPVFYVDTSLLFPETYALVAVVERRYGIRVQALRSALSMDDQRDVYGDELWKRDPDRCCEIRKVEPQRSFLASHDAWISGIRRDQTIARRDARIVHWDERFGVVKVNPFARWDEGMVWTYIHAHGLPYNALHDRSYPSIGCTHCTRAVRQHETARAGRWPAFAKVECGLHA